MTQEHLAWHNHNQSIINDASRAFLSNYLGWGRWGDGDHESIK